jgi:hypothetical protein
LFGDGEKCNIGYYSSFVIGDLNGDLLDDAVLELGCSQPDTGRGYRLGLATFIGQKGHGFRFLSANRSAPFPAFRLAGLCDGVLTVEMRESDTRTRFEVNDSPLVDLRLREGRLLAVSKAGAGRRRSPSPAGQ